LLTYDNLQAVKESSGDVRRVSAIHELVGERLAILVGLDDAVVESVGVGAVGWVAGLVNALPRESVSCLMLQLLAIPKRPGSSMSGSYLY
jgi:1-pyrroline-4-hydroxy-2-carboxylate deaminase